MHLGLLEVLDGAEISVARQELDSAVGAVKCGVDEVNGVLMRLDCILDALWLFGRLLWLLRLWLLRYCRFCHSFRLRFWLR